MIFARFKQLQGTEFAKKKLLQNIGKQLQGIILKYLPMGIKFGEKSNILLFVRKNDFIFFFFTKYNF